MKITGQCPKCGSTEIIANAKPIDRGHKDWEKAFTLATYGNPTALVFTDKHTSTVGAWVCVQCGYVEFYANSPSSLKLQQPL